MTRKECIDKAEEHVKGLGGKIIFKDVNSLDVYDISLDKCDLRYLLDLNIWSISSIITNEDCLRLYWKREN